MMLKKNQKKYPNNKNEKKLEAGKEEENIVPIVNPDPTKTEQSAVANSEQTLREHMCQSPL